MRLVVALLLCAVTGACSITAKPAATRESLSEFFSQLPADAAVRCMDRNAATLKEPYGAELRVLDARARQLALRDGAVRASVQAVVRPMESGSTISVSVVPGRSARTDTVVRALMKGC